MHMSTSAVVAPRSTIVVGAGIVGCACALALAGEGHRVLVLDPAAPGSGTSSGNAGGIVTGSVLPSATPALVRSLPSMVLDPHSAAVLRPGHMLRALPWLWRFLAAARRARVDRIAAALHALVSRSLHSHEALARLAQAEALIQRPGWLKVYRTSRAFANTALERALFERHGVEHVVLDARQIAELEPALDPSAYTRGIFQPRSGFVAFPRALAQRYFDAARARGMHYRCERVLSIEPKADGGVALHTDRAVHHAQAVVVAAGVWSAQLARQIGDRVSLEAERGYHLSFASGTAPLLQRPVVMPEHQFVLAPMHDGIALVSGDELAGIDAPPDFRRIRALLPTARGLLPALADAPVQREWMGHRPSTPDSLPVIGSSPRSPSVIYAFGHGHLGLTMAGITAELVADLVAQRAPRIDLSPYRPNRF
ncbi:MAG: FAD-dependent oxidoreductase [Rhodoferax sp.]